MRKNWRNRIRHISLDFIFLPSGFRLVTFAILLTWVMMITACKNDDSSHVHDTFTCPMHPTVISDRPGSCPVCGMDLVRKAREGENVEITEDLARLLKSPAETVVASVNTIRGEYRKHPVHIKAQGVVTYDTRNIYTIPARIGGRLEKFVIKYPFQRIEKGQKVAEIYSPEMVTAQRELLYLIERDPSNEGLIQGAKERLSLLGATAAQIENIIARRKAEYTFAVYSSHQGYVLAEGQAAPSSASLAGTRSAPSSMSGGGMGDMSGAATDRPSQANSSGVASDEIPLREGDYVNAGQTLFRVVNPAMLRIELNVPGSFRESITKDAVVALDFGDGDEIPATVDFIQPFFRDGGEFLTIRVYTKNSGSFTIGQLVNARIESTPVEGLWIPKQAVLDLGSDRIVFVKGKGVFEPKTITTGVESDGLIQVNGLASSEEIAANAQYLVDSESFIRTDP